MPRKYWRKGGLTLGEYREQRFLDCGFSPKEANFYRDHKISGANVQWLMRARKRFVAGLSKAERDVFEEQMEDLYSHKKKLLDGEGDKIWSPEVYDETTGEDQRQEVRDFWESALEEVRIPTK